MASRHQVNTSTTLEGGVEGWRISGPMGGATTNDSTPKKPVTRRALNTVHTPLMAGEGKVAAARSTFEDNADKFKTRCSEDCCLIFLVFDCFLGLASHPSLLHRTHPRP